MTKNLEALLAERRDLERQMIEEHARELAILFTDIVGSTQYYEAHGDLEGFELVQRHNALLFPILAEHEGRKVKTIGDAILAVFPSGDAAVRCAHAMQAALAEHNAASGGDPIRIRCGLHWGRALIAEDGDVFGDAVNTAARVVGKAGAAQVVITQALAEKLSPELASRLAPRGEFVPKGKSQPLGLFELDGQSAPAPTLQEEGPAPQLFVLELHEGPSGLKVTSVDGDAEKGALKSYEERPFPEGARDDWTRAIGSFTRGSNQPSYLVQVRELGQRLYREVFSERVAQSLSRTEQRFLRLHLDDRLVGVPWELAHDGKEPLALRFATGRVVSARGEAASAPSPNPGGHALVVSDPTGDLPSARAEGEAIARLLREGFNGEVRELRGPLDAATLLPALKGCALLHFAGHASKPSGGDEGGLQLADGPLSASRLLAHGGSPSLVFLNACHGSGGQAFHSLGPHDLASSLLRGGARHVLGPQWEIADADALFFALRFYERLLSGERMGEAARRARVALAEDGRVSFAAYVLYGEPRDRLRSGAKLASPQVMRARASQELPLQAPHAGSPRAAAAGAPPEQLPSPARRWWPLAVGGLVVVALAAALLVKLSTRTPPVSPSRVIAKPVVVPTGPVRLAVLPFKNVAGAQDLEFLREGLTEAIVTDFAQLSDIKLIERAQIDVDLAELDFNQTDYVDPATRAQLGKILGAELVVLGGFQRAGDRLRAHARVVRVETGDILAAVSVDESVPRDQPEKLFDVQDRLTASVRDAVKGVVETYR